MVRSRRGVAAGVLIGCAFAWAAPGADEPSVSADTIRQLLIEQRGAEAYAALHPRLETEVGDPLFDYLYGVASLQTGRAVEAIFAFERVLDQQPDNAEARAYLARALFEAGENDSARAEFERVLGATPPAEISREVERYLSAIDRRLDRDRTRYSLFVETGAGYDSNVSNATADRFVAVPALGGVLVELAPGSREEGSALWNIAGGGGFATPISDDWSLTGGASLRHRVALEATDFRQFTANGDLGLEWRVDGDDTLRASASAQRFDVGGERNRDLAGVTGQWQRTLDQRTQVTAFGQFAALRFPDQEFRDVNRYTGGVGWGHAFSGRGTPVAFASIYGGREDARRRNADQVERMLLGTRLGGQYTFDVRWSGYGAINYQYSDYDGEEPAFLRARREHYVDVTLGMRLQLGDGLSLAPQVGWATNEANIALFEYDRWETTLTLRSDF